MYDRAAMALRGIDHVTCVNDCGTCRKSKKIGVRLPRSERLGIGRVMKLQSKAVVVDATLTATLAYWIGGCPPSHPIRC
jgi:hypothetical protein